MEIPLNQMIEVRHRYDRRFKFWVRANDYSDPVFCSGIGDSRHFAREDLEFINITDPAKVANTQAS